MTEINAICSSEPFKIVNSGLNGTKFILILLILCIESVICVYLANKMWCNCNNNKTISEVNNKIKCIVTVYHICFMLWLVLVLILYLDPVFSQSTYDFSNLTSCIVANCLVLIPLTPLYLSLTLFWFYRLKGVFKGSKYEISKQLNTIIVCWTIIACVWSLLCLTFAVIMIIDSINNANSNEIFCLYHKQVMDFYPYMYNTYDDENNIISYKYKLENWHICSLHRHTSVFYLLLANTLMAIASIPTMHGLLFYQYVKRMKQHGNEMSISNTTNINSNCNNHNRNIYFNGLLGIVSVSTTLISFLLYMADSQLLSTLFFIDLTVNAILMIMVLNFGKWLMCPCCQILIDRLINVFEKRNSDSNGSNV